MLVELVIENFAVIDRLRVRFQPELNILTGETGSGKSIVVGALGLLLGARASPDMVRSGAERARVSGIFRLPADPQLTELLDRIGATLEEGELLVEREVLASGGSRAFVASRPVTLAFLRELAPLLADIHGQHEQQRLFSTETQLEMLDAFAGTEDMVERVGEIYRRWREVSRQLEQLDASEQERLRKLDLLLFQRNEIEAAAPRPGEDRELEAERHLLRNVARVEENTQLAYAVMYEDENSALAQLRRALRALEEVIRIDASLAPVRQSLEAAEIAIEEAAHEVRHYLGRLQADPARLEEIEARLAVLDRLKRKYGPTLEDVLRFLEQVRAELGSLESADEERARLKEEQERLASEYEQLARQLSEARSRAARELEKQLHAELASLAMERARFRVELAAGSWTARGVDRVQFLFSANPGEELRPLEKVASGGELSRVALALKTAIHQQQGRSQRIPAVQRTLVFDEIDAGIGGAVAETVGRKLRQLARANQILCVTHLPQIAGFADHHLLVEKQQTRTATRVAIKQLGPEERKRELGRMLSGKEITPEALQQAERLIRAASGPGS